MNKEWVIEKLIEKGHSKERAYEILREAEESSNPNYILNYFGLK